MTADEMFVNLLRVSQEDVTIHKFIKAIVSMNGFNRKSLLNTFIQEMAFRGAPSEFIQAIAVLRDEVIVMKIKEWLDAQA
jgi:hypothetical protein